MASHDPVPLSPGILSPGILSPGICGPGDAAGLAPASRNDPPPAFRAVSGPHPACGRGLIADR